MAYKQKYIAKQRSAFHTADAWDNFMRLWQVLVNSASITEYNERSNQLFEGVPESAYKYLLRTWHCLKECFVLAWTRNYKKFGHISTSRVEGAHSVI